MKKSVAVLGLGKYGRSLAENLYRLGSDVLAVDNDRKLIEEFAPKCTSAVCADLSDEEAVASLGLKDMDIVVVAMGRSLSASILSVAVAKEQGVPVVVAKSSSDRMSAILLKVGADKILDPEGEGGMRSARILVSASFKDFFELDSNMYMLELIVKKEWVGKNLVELGLRNKMNLNVVAMKEPGDQWRFVDPHAPLTEQSVLLVVMEKKDMDKWK